MFKLTPRFLLLISLGTLLLLTGCRPAMKALAAQSIEPASNPVVNAAQGSLKTTMPSTAFETNTKRPSQTLPPTRTPILNTIVFQTAEPPDGENPTDPGVLSQSDNSQENLDSESSHASITQMNADSPDQSSQSKSSAIVWKATHETGDLREWQQHGDFLQQGQSTYYSMVTSPVHSGNYSVGLTIDTQGYSRSGNFAAYLFYWDQLPNQGYYYSAWYYIPAGTRPQDWWNIWQWKSTYGGNTDNSVPMYTLDVEEKSNGELNLSLIYRPDIKGKIVYRQNILNLPTNKWVHIEAYYKKASGNSGEVVVWQNGVEIFKLINVITTMKDNTVYWSINHYTDHIKPNPSTIFIDDAAISTQRIGPDYTLPQ